MGTYGAATSIYSHFLARGKDVNYPKDMSMVLALGPRDKKTVRSDTAANLLPDTAPSSFNAALSGTN
jgi:hypothetical protein